MNKKIIILVGILCCIFSSVVIATESSTKSTKAEIYLRPEDLHPNGVNMEVGIASFWLEVGAELSGDSGEVSYQWYESKDGSMENLEPVPNETRTIFIPEQKIGTTYYCVGVITTVDGKSETEYTKLLEATFTPKIIDKVWIIDLKEPVIDENIENKATQYTDYELNSYYGYEITSVKWSPDDSKFEEGKEYTVDIGIEYWDNVEFAEELDVKINENEAEFIESSNGKSAIVSYTFEKLEGENIKEEKAPEIKSGENLEEHIATDDESIENNTETIDISAIILAVVFITLVIFSLILIISKK